jgi:hypothetical protein
MEFSKLLQADQKPPLEAARKFLRSYCYDLDSFDEVRSEMDQMVKLNPRTILAGLAGLESLLAHPPAEKGVLSQLVAIDANWPLNDPSDEGAMEWMRQMVALTRDTLGDRQPPPFEG